MMRQINNKAAIIVKSKALQFMARIMLGGVFIYASLDKIAFPNQFMQIVRKYGIFPGMVLDVFAYILPWIELILGVLLIVGLFIRQASIGICFLLIIFIFAILYKASSGNIENCGCFSMTTKNSSQTLEGLIIRDLALLMMGIILLFSNKSNLILRNSSENDKNP